MSSNDDASAKAARSNSLIGSASATTSLAVAYVGQDVVVYNFSTLQGNVPAMYGNAVFLWQGGPAVPSGQAPLASAPIATNAAMGSGALPVMLNRGASYLLGYAVGPKAANVCAAVALTTGQNEPASTLLTTVGVVEVSMDFVLVNYSVPPGIQPNSSGHWIGLWQGYDSYVAPATAKIGVPSNLPQGNVMLMAQLLRGMTYTVAYAAGPEPTALAASCTFTTAP